MFIVTITLSDMHCQTGSDWTNAQGLHWGQRKSKLNLMANSLIIQ